jgi:transcriptional regulator with GAF, ATPase, and Fis domain
MKSNLEKVDNAKYDNRQIIEEHNILQAVVKMLHEEDDLQNKLENVLTTLTRFKQMEEQNKAGIFLVEEKSKALRLFCTVGEFPKKFYKLEDKVMYGQCLCGKAAASGEIIITNSCCEDDRYDPKTKTKILRGAYVIPLICRKQVVGVMFLYMDEYPSGQGLGKALLLAIGGLIGDAIVSHQKEDELLHRNYELYELSQLQAPN